MTRRLGQWVIFKGRPLCLVRRTKTGFIGRSGTARLEADGTVTAYEVAISTEEAQKALDANP